MYILQQKTNKTLFGGILFIIYIIIMIIISLIYILNFAFNNKYDIRYTLYKAFTSKEEENNKNEDLNPHLNFSINIIKISEEDGFDLNESEANNFFVLRDDQFNSIERNKIISRTPSNFTILFGFKCFFDCTNEFYNDENNKTNLIYYLNITYSGYKIDHENKDTPLERNNDKYSFYKEFDFNLDSSTFYEVNWNVIKYKEERGLYALFDDLFDKKYEFTGIDIDYIEKTTVNKQLVLAPPGLDFYKFKILGMINMRNKHNQYVEYIRNKKSILDVLADIGALFSTLFSVFSFIFNFYSNNFDNYKIVKELLSKNEICRTSNKKYNKKIIKANSNKIEYIPFNKSNSDTATDDVISNNTCKTTPNNSDRINIEQKEEINLKENYNNKKNTIKFIYFLLENVVCKRQKIKREYNIIDICNNILYNYTSVENILYNQIIFENLLKDYHWNDESLGKVENNYLIKKLKLLLT